jgi:transposase
VQIAWQVGVSERSIYRWLEKGRVPSGEHSSRSASVMDPYQSYVLKRWQEGHRKGSEFYRELKEQGYHGSEHAVYRYLTVLRTSSSLVKRGRLDRPSFCGFSDEQVERFV